MNRFSPADDGPARTDPATAVDRPKRGARNGRLRRALLLLAIGIPGCQTATYIDPPASTTLVFMFVPPPGASVSYTYKLTGGSIAATGLTGPMLRQPNSDNQRPKDLPQTWVAYGSSFDNLTLTSGVTYLYKVYWHDASGLVAFLGESTFTAGKSGLVLID